MADEISKAQFGLLEMAAGIEDRIQQTQKSIADQGGDPVAALAEGLVRLELDLSLDDLRQKWRDFGAPESRAHRKHIMSEMFGGQDDEESKAFWKMFDAFESKFTTTMDEDEVERRAQAEYRRDADHIATMVNEFEKGVGQTPRQYLASYTGELDLIVRGPGGTFQKMPDVTHEGVD